MKHLNGFLNVIYVINKGGMSCKFFNSKHVLPGTINYSTISLVLIEYVIEM